MYGQFDSEIDKKLTNLQIEILEAFDPNNQFELDYTSETGSSIFAIQPDGTIMYFICVKNRI